MRTSILSRAVVAVAALGIGSAALAAVPATAATPSGITRDEVLTAANGLRIADPTDEQQSITSAAVRDIFKKGCGIPADSNDFTMYFSEPTEAGDDADGVLLSGYVYVDPMRACSIGVVATTDPAFQLSGVVTLSTQPSGEDAPATTVRSEALTGDVFATTPVEDLFGLSMTATGSSTKTTSAPGTKKIADKKSKAEKKAAKSKYEKRLKAAKKKYVKALDKAGNSKSKKSAAKKAYSKSRASAKAKYQYAIAGYKIVKTTVSTTENRPFSITADGSAFIP